MPTEPALGEPTVLPAPAEDPLAAPPALPPLAPLVPCADEMTVDTRIAIALIAAVTDALFIANLLFWSQPRRKAVVPFRNNFDRQSLDECLPKCRSR
jgi:hypothetical protein